jgi:hypothetical protein
MLDRDRGFEGSNEGELIGQDGWIKGENRGLITKRIEVGSRRPMYFNTILKPTCRKLPRNMHNVQLKEPHTPILLGCVIHLCELTREVHWWWGN